MGHHPSGSYRYADEGDRLTIRQIEISGLSWVEWTVQEVQVLDALTVPVMSLQPRHLLLDFGSGLGRLSLRFANLFDHVTSIEPDSERARVQRESVAAAGFAGKIEVRTNGLGGADIGRYDVAICSHVIQHIGMSVAMSVLDGLRAALRAGGYLLLLTVLSPADHDKFVMSQTDDAGAIMEQPVTAVEFDRACRENRPGRLPVRAYSYRGLIAALRLRALQPVVAYAFHGPHGVIGPLPGGTDEDVDTAELAGSRDIAILARAPG